MIHKAGAAGAAVCVLADSGAAETATATASVRRRKTRGGIGSIGRSFRREDRARASRAAEDGEVRRLKETWRQAPAGAPALQPRMAWTATRKAAPRTVRDRGCAQATGAITQSAPTATPASVMAQPTRRNAA